MVLAADVDDMTQPVADDRLGLAPAKMRADAPVDDFRFLQGPFLDRQAVDQHDAASPHDLFENLPKLGGDGRHPEVFVLDLVQCQALLLDRGIGILQRVDMALLPVQGHRIDRTELFGGPGGFVLDGLEINLGHDVFPCEVVRFVAKSRHETRS